MTPENLRDERVLRAWAIEQVMGSVMAPGSASTAAAPVDFIAVAQRIVDFVKGNGAAHRNGRGKKA